MAFQEIRTDVAHGLEFLGHPASTEFEERARTDGGDLCCEAERLAAEERDHNLWASLLALDAGLRALAPAIATDAGRMLLDALHLEIGTARRIVSRDGPEDMGAFDLAATIHRWSVLGSATGVAVAVELPARLIVSGSRSLTIEVLRSIFDNARNHAAGSPIRVTAEVDGQWVELRITDLGPGVPDAGRIFERGYSGGGSQGLGLYLASRSMRQQGGSLGVLQSDRGSTFALRFRLFP